MTNDRFRNTIAVATFLFLVLFVPSALITNIPVNALSINGIFLFAVLVYASGRIGVDLLRAEVDLLDIFFWVFVYLFLGLVPALQMLTDSFQFPPSPSLYPDHEYFLSSLVIIAGIVGYEIGRAIVPRTSEQRNVQLSLSPKKLYAYGILTAIVLTMAYFLVGGWEFFLTPRAQQRNFLPNFGEGQAGVLIVITMLRVPILVFVLALMVNRDYRKNQSAVVDCLILFSTLILLLVNNPVSTARYWVGVVMLSLILIKLRHDTFLRLIPSLFVACMLLVFPFADLFRRSLDPSLAFDGTSIEALLQNNIILKGDYDAYQQLLNTVHYVSQEGLSYGRQLLGVVLFWLPRSIWESKPVGTGEYVAGYLDLDYLNLSSPLWAEFYIDGGFLLVLGGFVSYGYFVKWLQLHYVNARAQSTIIAIFVPIYIPYQLFLLRGSLLSAFAYIAPIILSLIALRLRRSPPGDFSADHVGHERRQSVRPWQDH